MAKLADAPDLGSGGAIHVGSTPIIRTGQNPSDFHTGGFFVKDFEFKVQGSKFKVDPETSEKVVPDSKLNPMAFLEIDTIIKTNPKKP